MDHQAEDASGSHGFGFWGAQSIFLSQVGFMVRMVMMEDADVTGFFFEGSFFAY